MDAANPPLASDGDGSRTLTSQPSTGDRPLSTPLTPLMQPSTGMLPERLPLDECAWVELRILRSIGAGAFSDVFEALFMGTPCAVKRLRLRDIKAGQQHGDDWDTNERFISEIRMLSLVQHPNCLTLLAVCRQPLAIVTEFLAEGDLKSHLFYRDTPISDETKIAVLSKVAAGMRYLHSKGLVHADLKPSNVLVAHEFSTVKIADFGLAFVQAERVANRTGTFRYMACELLAGLGTGDPAVDVYAFGVMLFEVVTRTKASYVDQSRRDPFTRLHMFSDLRITSFLARQCESILRMCVAPNASDRKSFRSVFDALAAIDLKLGPLADSVPSFSAGEYVPRSTDYTRLKSSVLDACSDHAPVRLALCGMAGSGKTALAALLARDEDVRRRFVGGVFWLHARALGKAPAPTSPASASALLVVDDVADASQLSAVCMDSWSGILVTTRFEGLLQGDGFGEVRLAQVRRDA